MKQRRSKRDDILVAAAGLLGRSGIDGFTASALAEAAGVSKANLFHHFKSLDDVVIEAFERFALDMQMLAPPEDMGFRDWLNGIGDASFGIGETGRDMARAYFVFVAKALFDERLRLKVLGTANAASQAFRDLVAHLAPEVTRRCRGAGAGRSHLHDGRRFCDPCAGFSRAPGRNSCRLGSLCRQDRP